MNNHKDQYVIFVVKRGDLWNAALYERDEDVKAGKETSTGDGSTPSRAVRDAFRNIGQ